jgi:hypothetical protein
VNIRLGEGKLCLLVVRHDALLFVPDGGERPPLPAVVAAG